MIDTHHLAVELLDRRRERLERGEAEQLDLLEGAALREERQPLGQGLHFGELGHVGTMFS